MIIWRCDRCQKEQIGQQIVGHEFDYSQNFVSLPVPINGYTDLCRRCASIAEQARVGVIKKQDAEIIAAMKQVLTPI